MCVSFWCTLCHLLLWFTTSLCCNMFKERGHSHNFTCTFKAGTSASWQLYNGNKFIDIGTCTLGNNKCTDLRPSEYRQFVVKKGEEYSVYLNIIGVRPNETTFRCYTNIGKPSSGCHLKVYDVPRNIVCDPVDVDYTKMNLLFRCTAENVYPAIKASVNIIGAEVTKEDFISSYCSHLEPGSDTLEPYTAECIWRLPATKLEPLTYKYTVKMFPDVVNGTADDVPNIVSNYFTLELKSPQAAIDYHNCSTGPGLSVSGQLPVGSTASCKCVLEAPGFPPGQARWYDLHGNRGIGLDNLADGSSTLILYNKTSGQSYQCRAESALRNLLNWGPIYTPVFKSESKNEDVPRNIVCDSVDVDYTKMNLVFRCTAKNVHTGIKASVNIIGAAVTKEDFISSHCSNTKPSPDTLEPYTAECVWRLPAKKLEPLIYKYTVQISPDVFNGTQNDVPNIISNYFTLQLKSPQAAIDYPNCSTEPDLHNGQLLAGSTASCKCVLEAPGFPPGQARWYDLHGNRSVGLDNPEDGSSTLILYTKTSGQSYQCRADSALRNLLNWGPTYSPVFKSESKNEGPSSSHEGASFRLELVVGISAGSVVLAIVVAVAIWKCRRCNRQSGQTTTMAYNAHSDYMTAFPGPNSTDCSDYSQLSQ